MSHFEFAPGSVRFFVAIAVSVVAVAAAATLYARYRYRAPDAMRLATAVLVGVALVSAYLPTVEFESLELSEMSIVARYPFPRGDVHVYPGSLSAVRIVKSRGMVRLVMRTRNDDELRSMWMPGERTVELLPFAVQIAQRGGGQIRFDAEVVE